MDHFSDEPLNCPRCQKVGMRTVCYHGPDVDFTFCPFCNGVWLNAGDFKIIIDALNEEAQTKSMPEYVKASLKEASEIFTNPKRFISQWQIIVKNIA